MTCDELHSYFQHRRGLQSELGRDSADAARHLAACRKCSSIVEEEKNLQKDLRIIRESADLVPESLDAAVLAGYRRLMNELQPAVTPSPRRKANSVAVFAWRIAVAAVMVGAAILFFSARRPVPNSVSGQSVQREVPPSQATHAPLARSSEVHPVHAQRPAGHRRTAVGGEQGVFSSEEALGLPSDFFRGLMYCDPLSCAGTMDMIRVQLPSSVVATPQAVLTRTNDLVTADVLVGPDGIARGIRIEE